MNNVEDKIRALVEDKGLSRRLASGAKKLHKLGTKHKKAIALHLAGYRNLDISEMLQMPPSWVSITLRDPLARAVIESYHADNDDRLAALYPQAIDAVQRSLLSSDYKAALKASEIFFKTQGKFKEGEKREKNITAEDVARQIVQVKGEATITLETGRRLSIEDKKDDG